MIATKSVTSAPPARLAKVKEAAAYANVSERTVRFWIARGSLTPYAADLGDTDTRIDLDELDYRMSIRRKRQQERDER